MSQSTSNAIRPARRTENIRYAVRDVVLLAREAERAGKRMIHLNVGDPNIFDFSAADIVIDTTVEAMRSNRNGYAPSSGVVEAIAAIDADATRRGIRSICHTYVTSGASEAIDLALAALCDPLDNVLTPAPVYPFYTAALAKLDVENRHYHLDEEAGWQPDVEEIERLIDVRTRAIVLINPGNPTGTTIDRAVLERIVEIAIERNLVIFSDEIYDRLLFDGRTHVPTASISGAAKVLTLNGMSKAAFVPGFRIGWGIVSGPREELEDWCEAIRKMERARLSANHAEQYAIEPALTATDDHLREAVGRLERRRDITHERLNAMPGVSCVRPSGAFYAFPRIDLGIEDTEFVARVVAETGVVIVPGTGFGQVDGTQHFRVVFLPPGDLLHEAFDEIERVVRSIAG